jgi:hypothetical protein
VRVERLAVDWNQHFNKVACAIKAGDVVPFLGAGANMCDRPGSGQWKAKQSDFLPNATELSSYLADEFVFNGQNKNDLLQVSQYVSIGYGRTPLNRKLQEIFVPQVVSYSPNRLHRFLAELPGRLRELKCETPYQLIVTTNYDTLLETAFKDVGEKYHLVTYMAGGQMAESKFLHYKPDSDEAIPIEKPNAYVDLPIKTEYSELTQTIILKIHGAARKSYDESCFVITEDDYIEYLTLINRDMSNLLPAVLINKLKNSSKLFFGYSLRDWNMRALLYQIWKEQIKTKGGFVSWAIQLTDDEIEHKSWDNRGVEILAKNLENYVMELKSRL